MNKRILFLICFFLLPGLTAAFGQVKSVTLRTYFPEPIAAYDRIQLISNTATAFLATNTPCDPGTIVYHQPNAQNPGLLYGCYLSNITPPGEWRILQDSWSYNDDPLTVPNPIDIFPSSTIADLRIGIGTNSPEFQLSLDQDGGMLSMGNFGAGDELPPAALIPNILENNAKFLWYPRRSALIIGSIPTANLLDASGEKPNVIGDFSAALGSSPQAAAEGSMVLSGTTNRIDNASNYASISGGTTNTISSSAHSAIGGGNTNTITSALFNFIGGGHSNQTRGTVTPATLTAYSHETIIGGNLNRSFNPSITARFSPYSTIGGGQNNWAGHRYPERYGTNPGPNNIIGGQDNAIHTTSYSASSNIGAGKHNIINAYSSSIIGGSDNLISGGYQGFIGGGDTNRVLSTSLIFFIGGGSGNTINWGSRRAYIIGGEGNTIPGGSTASDYNVIVGGKGNSSYCRTNLTTNYGFLGGGEDNLVTTGTVGGGFQNKAYPTNYHSYSYVTKRSVIGGGANNTIGTILSSTLGKGSMIMGGQNNTVLTSSSWVGGKFSRLAAPIGGGGDYSFLWGHHNAETTTQPGNYSFIISTGRVGIQTISPDATLDIVGTMRIDGPLTLLDIEDDTPTPASQQLFRGQAANNYPVQRNDIAELFDMIEPVGPGHIVAIDQQTGHLKKSDSPYSKASVGVVSTSPAMIFEGDRVIINPQKDETATMHQADDRAPIALKGRVPVKVTLENGPIEPGDPLTTSSVAGHAMKSTDSEKSFGTTIGKALEGFSGGPNGETEGMIMVFVALY